MPDRAADLAPWPPHGTEIRPWRQAVRGGSKRDRMVTDVATRIPPQIGDLEVRTPSELTSLSERALVALGAMDGESTGQPDALARFMIRSESVASSKIERVSASVEDFARALAGNKANPSAVSMVAASTALQAMVDAAGEHQRVRLDDLLRAHELLMRDDPQEGPYAGTLREDQNWIGGSDYSPLDALYVPPPPDRVPGLLEDLLTFANRDDLPALAQVAIAHAQFESIHPFGDGNGRIGRALIGAILRRRGVTPTTVVPVASGLLARRDDYFDALMDYREGNLRPLVELMLRAAIAAAEEARVAVRRIKALPDEWLARSGARHGSAAERLLGVFFDNPVMSADDIDAAIGPHASSAQTLYNAVARLERDGILQEMTGRKRNRVWAAVDLMGELDALDARIAAAMRRR